MRIQILPPPPSIATGIDTRMPVVPEDLEAAECSTLRTETRGWLTLSVISLLIAGLLSLLVVMGRLPGSSRIIADPLFFRRCLVVHVNLSLVVWFYAFAAALVTLQFPAKLRLFGKVALVLSAAGVLTMLSGALIPHAEPILSNYIPVIDHPLFLCGLAMVFVGVLAIFLRTLLASSSGMPTVLPADAAMGIKAASLAVVLAAASWISAQSGLAYDTDRGTYFEFSAWGAGHVLQVANVCMMLAIWLWILARVTGKTVIQPRKAGFWFACLVAPHMAMPLLPIAGTLNSFYIHGATQLMRWGIFPVVIILLVTGLLHLRRNWRPMQSPTERALIIGFSASAALTVMGFILGALIRSSSTLVPAHYHASLGGVTAALMTAAYLIIEVVKQNNPSMRASPVFWRAASWQLVFFGFGQAVFAIGFAIGGLYGLGRKSYADESVIRSSGELFGLGIMGTGGLMATIGGIFFLILIIRELSGWWSIRARVYDN